MDDGPNTDRAVYLKHQAIAVLDAEKAESLRKIRKRHRKDAELAGVPLQDMDWAIKTLELPVGEIRKFFAQKLRLLSFNGINVGDQIADKIIGDHTEDRSYEGTLAGMAGKAASPPANLTPNEARTWLSGWHDGNAARNAALESSGAEEAAAAAARAGQVADSSTAAAAELGGDDYGGGEGGDEGADGFEASEAELAAQVGRPVAAEPEPEPLAAPHQPAKRARKPAAAH